MKLIKIALLAFLFFATSLHAQEHKLGNQNAKVTLIEYASLTCPHCATFHKEVLSKLTPYIDSGNLLYIYRDFPLDGTALGASMLAECIANKSGDKAYFDFIALLYKKQSEWSSAPDIKSALFKLASIAGFHETDSTSCLKNKEIYDAVIAERKQGEKQGVNATPSLFINGKKMKNTDYSTVKKQIEALLQ